MDAKDLLHKSIDSDIQEELELVKEEKTTFIKHWMKVISVIHLPTADKFKAIKKSIHTCGIHAHHKHNIATISVNCQED